MSKKCLAQGLVLVAAFLFSVGCATKAPVNLPSFSAKQFNTNQYESKVDNFVVVLDASSSMRHPSQGTEKFATAKAVAERLNLTLPEMGQTAGLRSFGHAPVVSRNHTELFYGMERYSTAAMAKGLTPLTQAGGCSPMGDALEAVQNDLQGLAGVHNAVVIITDDMDMPNALKHAQALKDKYGSSICFYPVLVGDAAEGAALLQDIARIGGCGFYSTADDLLTSAGMAAFVEKAFLAKKQAVKKAAPPAPKKMERKDSDGDGVYDDEDKCPGTPLGARVNAIGCWVLDNVLFDFDKAVIKPVAYPLLDEVVTILKKNPAMSVELQGHTDNIGTAAYNMKLSLRRAHAVAKYLVSKGIARNRLATTGFGFKRPVALNGTEFGRSLNRRVELHPY